MAEKLKSILNQTHWSLVFRALVFALAWLILPFPAFFIVALALFFFPFFHPFRLWFPFLLVLIFAGTIAPFGWAAIFLGVLFFLILGVKRLFIIDRFHAHQILIFLFAFLLFLTFFSRFPVLFGWSAFASSAAVAMAYFFLLRGTLQYAIETNHEEGSSERRRRMLAAGLVAFFVWQAMIALAFLPIRFLGQTALLLLCTVTATEIALGHMRAALSRRKLLAECSIFLALTVFILALNQWKV